MRQLTQETGGAGLPKEGSGETVAAERWGVVMEATVLVEVPVNAIPAYREAISDQVAG